MSVGIIVGDMLHVYGRSMPADTMGAVRVVGLAFNVLINEVDLNKMRVFLSRC